MRKFNFKGNFKVVTFDEFISHGKKYSNNIVDGMPWSFYFECEVVTHETDECYLLPIIRGTECFGIAKFTPDHLLLVDEIKEFYLVDKSTFRTWIGLN